ncbi:MAG TPA: polysaccharide pyruvyl transferase family protein [Ohtaekwangia sp.]
MRLNYFRDHNFGDTLNPIIFNKLLPGFFDDDPSVDFFGIGSIIGFDMVKRAKRKVIFSSGFAYGNLPTPDESYDFICVRGPNTAEVLNLDKKLVVTDGAALLRELKFPSRPKKYKFSFMPHWESERKYPYWKQLCEAADIHYISPIDSTMKIMDELLETEVMIAEAMHAAIVADTLRIPWIPVKAYQGINNFKWNDWAWSLGMEYKPVPLRSMYKVNEFVLGIIKERAQSAPLFARKIIAHAYVQYQNIFLQTSTIQQLKELKTQKQYLSADTIFNSKVDQLLDKLQEVKNKYPK